MRRWLSGVVAFLFLIVLPVTARAQTLIPVGRVIGIHLRSSRVEVAAFDDVLGHSARAAGLQIGDEILFVNGLPVEEASDVPREVKQAHEVRLTVRRGSRQLELTLPVHETPDGGKLGIFLRQGVAGIGTVTWYDPETGLFGALGHGVSEGAGTLVQLTGGSAWEAGVEAVKKGTPGRPGQLRGAAREEALWGQLHKNTPQGIFGSTLAPVSGKAVETADYDDIRPGPAAILATVSGDTAQEYSVEIVKIYPQDREDGRNFLLHVTDARLLEQTGGIVQGMSGSPIIQNGKLIGAVTHVLVNDPTRGYGIFIENMLEAAG